MSLTTEIEDFKLETARQVVAAIKEKKTECVFTLMEFYEKDKQLNDEKKRTLNKVESILKKSGIKTNVLIFTLCPVAPDDNCNL
jgi:hypothetical protein